MEIANRIQRAVNHRPWQVVLVVALLLRMIAAIFSRGFGMHDDHFLVLEPAQAWADGINYQGWLPGDQENVQPDGHSLLYSGVHYLILMLFNFLNLGDPQFKMLIIRIMHGLFSLLIVSLGYKITLKIAGEKQAFLAGLLLATLWFMPMLSVRNLVEIVCIPLLMLGSWYLLQANDSKSWQKYLLAGIFMGIGFSIRFQTAAFIGGTGLALLMLRHWKGTFVFASGVLLAILPVQGLIDYFVWKYPFAEFIEYVRYNLEAANDYITGPWYNYVLLLSAILLPPVSIFLIIGFFRVWRKHLLLWLPSMIFLVFHSVFPNKQERFIFPIIPYIVILGVTGYYQLKESYFQKKPGMGFVRGSWVFFWIVNLLLLAFITISYSKRSRVETMTYLSNYKDIEVLLLEDTNHGDTKMLPQFYLGQWVQVISKTNQGFTWYTPLPRLDTVNIEKAGFVCFFEDTNLDKRVEEMKKVLPGLEYETTVQTGLIDNIMFRLNPVNLNQTIIIYRNSERYPEKLERK